MQNRKILEAHEGPPFGAPFANEGDADCSVRTRTDKLYSGKVLLVP